MSAFPRLLTEPLREFQQFPEPGLSHHIHDALIVFRPLGAETIRTLLLQFMGKVPAGNNHRPASQTPCRTGNQLSGPVMVCQGKPGTSDAHQLVTAVNLVDEIQGNHGSMVQFPVPPALASHGEIRVVRKAAEFFHKSGVILCFHCLLRGKELAKVPLCTGSRGYMEVIRIHHRVGRQHHNGIRL